MAEKNATGLAGRLHLLAAPDGTQPDPIVVHAIGAEGQVVGTAKVDAQGRFSLSATDLKSAVRIAIGDAQEDPGAAGSPSLGYYVDDARELFASGILSIPPDVWGGWFRFTQCVSGTVRRCYPWRSVIDYLTASTAVAHVAIEPFKASAATIAERAVSLDLSYLDPAIIGHPFRCAVVCRGIVEVYRRTCCCRPPIIVDPGLVDGPVDIGPVNPPDPPDLGPFAPDAPGPLPIPPGPGPDPAPLQLLDGIATGGALSAPKLNAQRDLIALRTLKGSQLADYISLRPYLWCTCGVGTKVAQGVIADDGSFSVCWRELPRIVIPNCSDEYAYRVTQVINGISVTIYDGVAAGQWFSASAHPTLTSYSAAAVACGGDTGVPGAGDAIVLLHEIGSTEAWHLGTPNQDSPDSVQTLGHTSGLIDPAAVDGPSVNRPLGGTLGLRYFFSRGMQTLGARFFRVDVATANAAGDPVGSWAPVPVPAWTSWNFVSGTGFVRAQHSLGPDANGQYLIPFETGAPLAALEQWDPDQFHALLDASQHPTGRYLIRVEVFDAGGNQIKPAGATGPGTARPFVFGLWRNPPGPPDNVPWSALTHTLWLDNRPATAVIEGVRLATAVGSPTCQFLDGAPGDHVAIDFRAFHPHPTIGGDPSFLQSFSLVVTKGIGGGTPLAVSGFGEPGKPPGSAAVNSSATLASLLGADPRCAFAVTLRANVKTTNGSGLLTNLDAEDVAAFAAEQH